MPDPGTRSLLRSAGLVDPHPRACPPLGDCALGYARRPLRGVGLKAAAGAAQARTHMIGTVVRHMVRIAVPPREVPAAPLPRPHVAARAPKPGIRAISPRRHGAQLLIIKQTLT